MSTFSALCTSIVDFGNHNSNPRKDKVSKITIHHMAGVMSGKDCANYHKARNASSANYYIGNGGDICGGVSEDRRAWTSGTGNGKGTNDHMAITIEVSNSKTAEPWPVSDKAYKATIALCADICKRYGITPHFTGDANGTLTLHCMFQNTACPGSTWKDLHKKGSVEADILAAMGQVPAPDPKPENDEKKIWDYFHAKIGNDFGVAGLMGNIQAESGLRPNNLQNTFEKRLGMTDAQYTAAVDNGSYGNFVGDGAGFGLCQWTSSGRKAGLLNMKNARGCSIADLQLQLDWCYEELANAYKTVLEGLKKAVSIYEAASLVLTKFEKPANQSEAVKLDRTSYGQVFFDRYGQAPTPTPSKTFIVRITADELNVREGPGTNSPVVMTVRRGEAFTIVQTAGDWGFLKSGVGWINLHYTQRL